MKKHFVIILLSTLFSGCAFDSVETVNTDNINFNISEGDRLFFDNVARASYEKEDLEDSRIDVYRHQHRMKDTVAPYINAAIALNGMDNEAYIYIEPSPEVKFNDSLEVLWSDFGTRESGSIWLNTEDYRSQFVFAAELFNHIAHKHELHYRNTTREKIPIFRSEIQQKIFMQTMRDYYKLIGVM
ncbi:MAG: hypothetical protein WD077_14770 [Bacteroidia bacterium]